MHYESRCRDRATTPRRGSPPVRPACPTTSKINQDMLNKISVASTAEARERWPTTRHAGAPGRAVRGRDCASKNGCRPGDLDVLDCASLCCSKCNCCCTACVRIRRSVPRPARQDNRHQHHREHHTDGPQRDRRRRDDQHPSEREDDYRFRQDVDCGSRDQFVSNVRRARIGSISDADRRRAWNR